MDPVPPKSPFPPPFDPIPAPAPLPDDEVERLFDPVSAVKISVILPALNESVLLQRTVEQFQATLPEPSEIIVVDNGSTDGCSDFLQQGGADSVLLIKTPNPLGVAGARNRGLADARGEIVVFADAHTDVPERWWQRLVAALKQPSVGVVGPAIGVMGKPLHHASCGQHIVSSSLTVRWSKPGNPEPHPVLTLGGGFMAMRRDLILKEGAFDSGMPQWGSEDLEICLRYWLLGYEVWVVPGVVVRHYFREENSYEVDDISVTQNLLRVAVLHLSGDRLVRAIAALQYRPDFAKAMAITLEGDAWERRNELLARRVRDIHWLFDRFKGLCPD